MHPKAAVHPTAPAPGASRPRALFIGGSWQPAADGATFEAANPATGGTNGPVTYIAFTGPDARIAADDILDHALAEAIGATRAEQLVVDN